MYRDILMPVYMKLTQAARDRGLPIQFHNCGRCEDFYDDMLKLGVVYTDPAQTTNDLLAAKEKYGTKLVFCGGWDWDLLRTCAAGYGRSCAAVCQDAIDKYAPGGSYAFAGGVFRQIWRRQGKRN